MLIAEPYGLEGGFTSAAVHAVRMLHLSVVRDLACCDAGYVSISSRHSVKPVSLHQTFL